MGYKVQYNPSTGKVGYTAGTGKVQVVDAPGYTSCAAASGYIITFTDIEIADGCCIWPYVTNDIPFFYADIPNINGRSFRLHHFINCLYGITDEVIEAYREVYSSTPPLNCEGSPSRVEWYYDLSVRLQVGLPENENAFLEVGIGGGGYPNYIFRALYDTTGLGGDIIDTPNQTSYCISAGLGGTAIVKGIYRWEAGINYTPSDTVKTGLYMYTGGNYYTCTLTHTSSLLNEPPNATYWTLIP